MFIIINYSGDEVYRGKDKKSAIREAKTAIASFGNIFKLFDDKGKDITPNTPEISAVFA